MLCNSLHFQTPDLTTNRKQTKQTDTAPFLIIFSSLFSAEKVHLSLARLNLNGTGLYSGVFIPDYTQTRIALNVFGVLGLDNIISSYIQICVKLLRQTSV